MYKYDEMWMHKEDFHSSLILFAIVSNEVQQIQQSFKFS